MKKSPKFTTSLRGKQHVTRTVQLCLDLGQNLGPSQCMTCGMVYSRGHPEDEREHRIYHQSNCSMSFRIEGRSHERIIFCNKELGRVIHVKQTDSAAFLTKVKNICKSLESALGYSDGWVLSAFRADGHMHAIKGSTSQEVFLMVSAKKVVTGVLVVDGFRATDAVSFSHFHGQSQVAAQTTSTLEDQDQLQSSGLGQGAAASWTLGVRTIWVHEAYRREGRGTYLIDLAR
ncbi:hypothetical protein CEUSTIGMA_g1361.t1 [Chlamydomonas eustigma]|uniref:Uncharacterized protein n=1 Tax=Chlamydomonas eustigma TaxID=1157962 RepID=A0A250WSY5_9CHLO|nr:hypothetical protein CEUSTIGMA_g1361.t1 [Chlamydomonas eustigma]|eukprot:GAX73911.1 hypothetical protein CEUSTIGMA_g1361.t1 [Chlamydomonas eustigma]